MKNKQVEFWRGEFGTAYLGRNAAEDSTINNRKAMWRNLLEATDVPLSNILEVGSNIGLNLRALHDLVTAELFAVEPNATARAALEASGVVAPDNIFDSTAQQLPFPDKKFDLVFTSGVLIHIGPQDLLAACQEIHRVSGQFVACAEYFNTEPVEIPYHGHAGVLFKRDFGAFWLDNFPDLTLVDYGFFWKRATGLDDLTWWIFRKA